MSHPYEGLQELVAQVPALVQPVIIGVAAMVPYVEGEGAAALGVLAGVHPVVAGLAAAAGNFFCVVLVVLLGGRARTAVVGRRSRRAAGALEPAPPPSKGRRRLQRWLVRFGVPGASLIAPLALPTMLTAAAFVASGVRKQWVVLWQAVAIVVWTGVVTVVSTGVLTALTS